MKNNKNVLFMIRESYLKPCSRSSDFTERSTEEQGSFHRDYVAYFKCLQKQIFFVFLFMLLGYSAFANNISISNASLTGQVTGSHTMVQFDISWENSWRTSSGAANWDAAWVFVKYRVTAANGGDGLWHHAWLNNTYTAPTGSTIDIGLLNPTSIFEATTNPGLGAFIYRDAAGTGENAFAAVKLRWNYGVNGVADGNLVDIQIFAIEMVYVPEGDFYVGSGGTETGSFYKSPTTTDFYQITNEDAIIVGTETDNLYSLPTLDGGDRLGPIPAAFPKGHKAFYCMKYEIMQQQYVDFLNSLTTTQAYYRYDVYFIDYRYSITVSSGVYSTANPYVACNYLSWADMVAYLDWSGLRPMTELEFEKSCRGTQTPVPGEYAWGSNLPPIQNTGITNPGLADETSSNSGNCTYNHHASVQGPMRVGALATSVSTRVTSGATYYGIMEMSGNLWERPITVGKLEGRAFTGTHGNGALDVSGDADVLTWPASIGINKAKGTGFRGGDWYNSITVLCVSDRWGAADVNSERSNTCGGRGVRTAP